MVELLGRTSKRNSATKLRSILAGDERDCLLARATRSVRWLRRLSEELIATLVLAYEAVGQINDRAAAFGASHSTVGRTLKLAGVTLRDRSVP